MNEVVKYLFEAYANFYLGIILSLTLWGVMDLTFKLLDKLANSVYQKYKAYKKRKETQQAAQVPNID